MDTYINVINSIIKTNKETRDKGEENFVPYGPICGNGDIALTIEADNDDLTINIGKSDFRKFSYLNDDGEMTKIGTFRIGNLDLKNCVIEQKMKEGVLRCVFGKAEIMLFVSPENIICIEITASQNEVYPTLTAEITEEDGASVFTCRDRGLTWYLKKFDGRNIKTPTAAALCCRRMPSEISDGIKKVRFCISVVTNFDEKGYEAKCIEKALNSDYEDCLKKTNSYWKDFFSKSQVTLPYKDIEKLYNGSLFLSGCCMGNKRFAFNVKGNFIGSENIGDTVLNKGCDINIQPFYGAFSSNHPYLADGFIDNIVSGKSIDCLKGFNPIIPIMRFEYGVNREYLENKIYPYLKKVGELYKKYLKKENGRYIIKTEGAADIFNLSEKEKQGENNTALLGLYKRVFKCLAHISKILKREEESKEYKKIYVSLPQYPICIKGGKRRFKESEKSCNIKKSPYVLKQIYPSSDNLLISDKKLLKISKNTYFLKDRRFDDWETVTYHICGARLKVKPDFLIEGLQKSIEKKVQSNMLYNGKNGAAPYFSLFTGTVNEMLMQSYDGVIRLFPCFKKEEDAFFKNLRALGGFLVSAQIKGGKITEYKIKSLYGEKCKAEIIEGVKITVQTKNGKRVKFKKKDNIIEFYTEEGGEYILV